MIDRAEILAVATDLGLRADVVEKDYVLGWMLFAISRHDILGKSWSFKGGTCLKKCYLETYRFSEDLDFTVGAAEYLQESFLQAVFAEIATRLYDEAGIEIPAGQARFEVFRNKRDKLSCQGRIYYRGPLQRGGDLQRLKLDLTVDEILVLPPVERPIHHPYSDGPLGGMTARCYAFVEVFAEKIRALAERTRPRDLYDVVNLFRSDFRPSPSDVAAVLEKKCAFKGIAVPTSASFGHAEDELRAEWGNMLGHQLPALPPFETFWSALPEVFSWLQGGPSPAATRAAPLGAGEKTWRPALGGLRREGFRGSSLLELIRFAGSNRLCVDLQYDGTVRRIEPYSLRRTKDGALILFAVKSQDGQVRSYRVDRIQGAQVAEQTFTPRYTVELAPGEVSVPSTARRSETLSGFGSPRRSASVRYVYRCSACGKTFHRAKPDSSLRAHKAPQGWPCPGRVGLLEETTY
jgi:predicted nucleotidyltransferase component of viral defense system/DNA-directed RNA polymerase subunit RPC12/RpoP